MGELFWYDLSIMIIYLILIVGMYFTYIYMCDTRYIIEKHDERVEKNDTRIQTNFLAVSNLDKQWIDSVNEFEIRIKTLEEKVFFIKANYNELEERIKALELGKKPKKKQSASETYDVQPLQEALERLKD